MSSVVVIGMQWGDEGKGKIVDLLCPAFPYVVRYQGGHNAGHTVRFGDKHFALHLIPSGILHPGVECHLGNGMVVHPDTFLEELEGLEAAGVESKGRLFISERAQVLTLAHSALDQARENARGDNKIGTTARGIGPAYETKIARFGMRMIDLVAPDLEDRLKSQIDRIQGELEGLGVKSPDLFAETLERCRYAAPRLEPLLCDTSLVLTRALREGHSVLFEGAQGTLLDVDHGTYPYVTSSNATAGGAATGTGVAPTHIDGVVGILKAYTTRVGAGPFPTELLDDTGEYLRQRGREFGTTTGRPRRCGWLDLVIARYAQRVNGVGSIALTKLDVLDTLEEIEVCTAYRLGDELLEELPADTQVLERIEPVYKSMRGWRRETVGLTDESDLPQEARDYIDFLEQEIGAEVGLVSSGPRREETILTSRPALRGWVGDRLEVVARQLA